MQLANLVVGVRRFVDTRDPALAAAVHATHAFRVVLEKERARTDRNGDPFSLVTFSLTGDLQARRLQSLVELLRDRVRFTDEIGRLDNGRLAVLLPSTHADGAWKLASDVLQSLADQKPPSCHVYVYPSDASDSDDGVDRPKGSHGDDLDGDDLNGNPLCERAASTAVENAPHRDVLSGVGDRRAAPGRKHKPARSTKPVKALETLLVKPMPVWKRGLDIIGATFGVALFSPLLLAAAAAVKMSSPGPVLFCQQRAGLGGRRFTIYKFRTMVDGAERRQEELRAHNEQDGPAFKIKNDPRITRIGRFLRVTSIDELPQFLNVLKGDMSLVGPRPLPIDESDACYGWRRRRMDVTPGLTCIWQVSGRSTVSFDRWVRMDLEYIRHRRLWTDIKLLLRTVTAVLARRGAR